MGGTSILICSTLLPTPHHLAPVMVRMQWIEMNFYQRQYGVALLYFNV